MDIPLTLKAPLILALERGIVNHGKREHRVALDPQPEGFNDDAGVRHEPQVYRYADGSRDRISVGRVIFTQEMPWNVGDRLWIRETIRWDPEGRQYRYAADGSPIGVEAEGFLRPPFGFGEPKTVQARSCPRYASRWTCIVEATDVQRLCGISESDAVREGVIYDPEKRGWVMPGMGHPNKDFPWLSRSNAREMVAAAWDWSHGSGAWLQNPWVAVARFRVLPQNIDGTPGDWSHGSGVLPQNIDAVP